jgi:hypothetical protein
MLRAFILYLLGARFEVRVINLKSGKDIPGTCLYKGGYWKCRKLTGDKELKPQQMIRLQAVTTLERYANHDIAPVLAAQADESEHAITGFGEVDNETFARISQSKPTDPDAFDPYTGTDFGDHECDRGLCADLFDLRSHQPGSRGVTRRYR